MGALWVAQVRVKQLHLKGGELGEAEEGRELNLNFHLHSLWAAVLPMENGTGTIGWVVRLIPAQLEDEDRDILRCWGGDARLDGDAGGKLGREE